MSFEDGRREFLCRASLLIPAMHLAALGGATASGERAAGRVLGAGAATDAASIAIQHLRLRVRAPLLGAMREFYRKNLELPIVADGRESFTVRTGASEVQFVAVEGEANPFYHFAFNIPENKLDSAVKWMDGRAPLIPQRGTGNIVFHFAHWNAHAIYFNDPSGNVVEFIARHTMKNPAEGDFGVRDILAASEIGIVVPEVPATAAKLKERLGVRDYAGTSPTFAPLGDENGLLIVFPVGRNWLSSNIPTAVYPAEVRIRGAAPGKLAVPEASYQIEVTR